MYTAFASLYDELMADIDYTAWAQQYVLMMTRAGIPHKAVIVECACGTGGLTLPLRRSGYQITGVDTSEDMLNIAVGKASREGLTIPWIKQDMRHLHLHRPADAILSTCDGVNYLLTPQDVKMFFAAAHHALKPGGGLFFDVSTPDKLSATLGDNTLIQDSGRILYIWQNHYQSSSQLCDMDLCLFARAEDGRYDRIDEHQTQRAHTREELSLWLAETGFDLLTVYDDIIIQADQPSQKRWHYSAVKRR
jgi:ubiquinone/menaquinone biosynthesis C-methylase UbiE